MQTQSSGARRFLFLLGSARSGGNTESLARQAAQELPAGTEQEWISLRDVPLATFDDLRHAEGGFPEPSGNERLLFDATLAATDIVVASPLYWYAVSASTKLYIDYWSAWLRVSSVDFKAAMRAKTLWAVAAYAGDRAKAEPSMATLRLCASYFDMGFGGALLGNGTRPGDVLRDTDALAEAKTFLACLA